MGDRGSFTASIVVVFRSMFVRLELNLGEQIRSVTYPPNVFLTSECQRSQLFHCVVLKFSLWLLCSYRS